MHGLCVPISDHWCSWTGVSVHGLYLPVIAHACTETDVSVHGLYLPVIAHACTETDVSVHGLYGQLVCINTHRLMSVDMAYLAYWCAYIHIDGCQCTWLIWPIGVHTYT